MAGRYTTTMLHFDPLDPFPLTAEGSHSYADAQLHSMQVDEWLGFDTSGTESRVKRSEEESSSDDLERPQLWSHLSVQTFQTPYSEIRAILHQLNLRPGDLVADLGAGYGRMGLVIGRHYPEIRFVGYEIAEERVREGNRIYAESGHTNIELTCADLSAKSFRPVEADVFFVYDFGTRRAIAKALEDLRAIASRKPILVVGRGRSSRDAIEHAHPWLSGVVPPEHFPHFSFYRSAHRIDP